MIHSCIWNTFIKAILITVMLTLLLSGCISISGKNEEFDKNINTVNLIYYTLGNSDPDLKMVNDKINELLAQKIGITITYIKIGWQEYNDRINTLISTGTPFDIAFTTDYSSYVQRGAWLRLDSYLSNFGKDMYDAIDPVLWQGVRMEDGGIYGVPTNKELAVRMQWMYPETLVQKYDIDITKYNSLESLDPLFQMIKEKEPSYQLMEMDKDSQNFFAMYGYEYVLDKPLPLMVRSLDPDAHVINIFEAKEARQVLDTLRSYYVKGYINEDAALRESQNLKREERVFWKSAGGGPLSENSWSKDRGYKVVAYPVTPPLITTESVRGGIMAINAKSAHPVESVKFLNLLNTDPEIRNLFNYGIEGVHYTLDKNGQVLLKSSGDSGNDPVSEVGYEGVQYTQGNWFILKTIGGKYPDPLDKWDQYRAANAEYVTSKLLGFTPNLTRMSIQVNLIKMVWEKYYPSLMTGSVDVDRVLPKFNEELKQAGLDEVRTEVQRQLDVWRADQMHGIHSVRHKAH
ncbi:ABC transporter substrate-binding protein [Paenibacillus sp. 276b]|uniref:ABC transporter substrate-binding protein n=1 Tax=Paenibacillus sp. 276b TaxID=1566277 RepID=UPI000897045F|nr:ABC transporter substrate-binding protein [Paenibacillus sp. 276b]SEA67791.1 ABC-type glycerol-3-phosphate transport system, substrate-binding protein [Paenibacillus sp. 276b]